MKKQTKRIIAILFMLATLFALSVSTYAASGTLKVSKSKVSIYAGDKYTVSATYDGKKITPKWTTNKKAVATVSGNGVIVGKKAGTAVVTAAYKGKKVKVTVKVVAPKQYLTVTGKTVKMATNKTMILGKGKTQPLVVKLATKRAKTTYKALKPALVKWTTSNKNIATINKNGVITAKKAGKVIITGIYKKLKYKFTLTVTNPATCTHSWSKIYKTIHHDAVTHQETIPSKTEKIWHDGEVIGYVQECGCGQQFNSMEELNQHQFQASLNGEDGHASHWEIPVTSEGYYETVTIPSKTITIVDKPAYDEKTLTGYKCTKCGQTKSK